jgi:uncharacterized protein YuzE
MEKMNLFYDKKGDVLYISIGSPRKAVSQEMDDDILLRVDTETREVVGLTVLNFAERFSDIDHPQPVPVSAKMEMSEG